MDAAWPFPDGRKTLGRSDLRGSIRRGQGRCHLRRSQTITPFGDTPELAIKQPQVNTWDALATGAVTVRDRIVATLSAVPGAGPNLCQYRYRRAIPSAQGFPAGASAGIQAIKDRSAGIANGLLSSLAPCWESRPDSAGGRAEATARKAAPPAESIGQRIIESVLSLVPRLDERLVPKALSAMLMLQPVMATAAPPPQPMNGTVQTAAGRPSSR